MGATFARVWVLGVAFLGQFFVAALADDFAHDLRTARTEAEATDRARKHLERKSLSELGAVCAQQQEDSAAIYAGWELLRRSFPHASDGDTIQVNSGSAEHFLGFLEGRLRVEVPRNWSMAIRAMEVTSPKGISFSPLVKSYQGERLQRNEVRWRIGSAPSVSMSENVDGVGLECTEEGIRTTMQDAVFSKFVPQKLGVYQFSVRRLSKGQFVFLSINTQDVGGVVGAFDEKTKDLRWIKEVFVGTPLLTSGEPETQQATLVISNDRAIVFGRTSFLVYIQGFSLSSGDLRLRFAGF